MESIVSKKGSETGELIEAARAACKPEKVTVTRGSAEQVELLVLRDGTGGLEIVNVKPYLDAYLEAPERREGRARHTTLRSFIAHVKRFADADSALFVVDDVATPTLTCVFDYHRAGAEGAPRFGRHVAEYRFPVSEEWRAWTAKRDWLAQADFAALIEDRCLDVLDPSAVGESTQALLAQLGIRPAGPAKLQSLARGLTIKAEQTVANRVNLDTGETKLIFDEKHKDEAGNEIVVPSGFVVAIPVFREGAHYQLPVRLRYRLKSGSMYWALGLCRTEESFRDALEEACATAVKETGLPLFHGTPES